MEQNNHSNRKDSEKGYTAKIVRCSGHRGYRGRSSGTVVEIRKNEEHRCEECERNQVISE